MKSGGAPSGGTQSLSSRRRLGPRLTETSVPERVDPGQAEGEIGGIVGATRLPAERPEPAGEGQA
jgi:hypothetical protein